jgi:actin-related protein 2
MTEAIMNPLKNREKMLEVLFEKFGFKEVQVGIQALLSLFAEGLFTATLLDSGDGVTHCIPIYDGIPFTEGVQRINVAGRHVTTHLTKLLFFRGYAFNSSADFETVREIKERFCFVSSELALDRRIARETTAYEEEFMLPDQSLIKVMPEGLAPIN